MTDPAVLDRLHRRGEHARNRSLGIANSAAKRAVGGIEWLDERAVGIALALAPIGRETDDIGGRLFVQSFRDEAVPAAWRFGVKANRPRGWTLVKSRMRSP